MPKVPVQLDFSGKEKPDSLWQMLQRIYKLVAQTINGKLGFGQTIGVINVGDPAKASLSDNIDGMWMYVQFPAAPNTDLNVVHNLGRNASGYLVMAKAQAGDVYTSVNNVPSNTTLILRSTVASQAVVLFVI